MTEQTVIAVRRCKTVEDAIHIRDAYQRIARDIEALIVDMSLLDRHAPDTLLLGVLLNMRRHFREGVEIRLSAYPHYLPALLKICRKESLFSF